MKKYFYVLRPLLAARWILATGGPPPVEFEKLLAMMDADSPVLSAIRALLEQKEHAPELGRVPAVPLLHEFIEDSLNQIGIATPENNRAREATEKLNRLFQAVLRE